MNRSLSWGGRLGRILSAGSLLAGMLVMAAAPASHATLNAVGAVDPAIGYPTWYQDANGTMLKPCLDANFCTAPVPDPTLPPSVPGNYPDEGFYFSADTTMTVGGAGKGLLVMALETTFLNGPVVAGDQITFGRVRIRADHLVPGASYTVTHPYGTKTLVASSLGALNDTEDVGCFATPCNFAAANATRIGPFLRWDPGIAPAAPAGHLGNPFIDHRVTGSPFGTNFFRISGLNAGGVGVNTVQTDLFAVEGTLVTGPAVTVTPGSVTFPNTQVRRQSAVQTVTVTSTGDTAVTLGTVTVDGLQAADFTKTTDSCSGVTLAVRSRCSITLVFAPSAAGTRSATLNITDNGPASPHAIPLTGTATAPVASLSPTSITFATTTTGSTSTQQNVTLTNTGDASMVVSAVTRGGANPADFTTVDGCSGRTILAGSSCTVGVQFAPKARGSRTASLFFNDDAVDSPQIVSLAGTAVGPSATITPASLTFPRTALGVTSASQSVTVTSDGDSALVINSVTLTGANPSEFTVTNSCAPATLLPGATCSISVAFRPAAGGTRTANLSINDNAGGHLVSLTGDGAGPVVSVSPGSINFGSQLRDTAGAPQLVTVTNTGDVTVSFSSVTITGKFARNFQIVSNGCVGTLAPTGSCTISVRFAPHDQNTLTATLAIVDNAGTQNVALSGTVTR